MISLCVDANLEEAAHAEWDRFVTGLGVVDTGT